MEMYVYISMTSTQAISTISCQEVQECRTCVGHPQNSTLCLHFTVNSSQVCLVENEPSYTVTDHLSKSYLAYQCGRSNYKFLLCINSGDELGTSTAEHVEVLQPVIGRLMLTVHSQSLYIVDRHTYKRAQENCEAHSEHSCHWIPDSLLTKKHCYDCQPICRSTKKTLSFAQFCIGAMLLMLSIPIGRESLTAVISDSVARELQVSMHGNRPRTRVPRA